MTRSLPTTAAPCPLPGRAWSATTRCRPTNVAQRRGRRRRHRRRGAAAPHRPRPLEQPGRILAALPARPARRGDPVDAHRTRQQHGRPGFRYHPGHRNRVERHHRGPARAAGRRHHVAHRRGPGVRGNPLGVRGRWNGDRPALRLPVRPGDTRAEDGGTQVVFDSRTKDVVADDLSGYVEAVTDDGYALVVQNRQRFISPRNPARRHRHSVTVPHRAWLRCAFPEPWCPANRTPFSTIRGMTCRRTQPRRPVLCPWQPSSPR